MGVEPTRFAVAMPPVTLETMVPVVALAILCAVVSILFCKGLHWTERLLDRGILIRSCADFQGLGPGFYRVCVRSRGENQRLIQAIQQEREAFHG